MVNESDEQVSSSDSTIVRIVDTIKKSDGDPLNYRGLELSNEMLVLLISDPSIARAIAVVDVNIGSYADPKEAPGIAHFLEHMLFMGSSKYPGENEYSKLIKGNGGSANAFTTDDHTTYYFDINTSALPDALDVFAQFFISPLFAESSVDREIEAVNSEYEGDLMQDGWRISQVEQSTSDPQHPYSKFTIGNTESLRTMPKQHGLDIRQLLLDFHKNEYSSNRMSLVVFGDRSLDELQSLVIKSFKDVPNKKLKKPTYPPDPYGENKRKTICYCIPVDEQRNLAIKWVIPDHTDSYYCNPESYLSHLVGHEGDGSLLSYLRKLGLATELMGGKTFGSASGFDFFTADIELTNEGLNQWEQVVYIVYQYFAMLRKEGPQEWIFNELKNLSEMGFKFWEEQWSSDSLSRLAGRMKDYPLAECLSGIYEMREFRPDLITEELNEYLIPSKMRVFLSSKTFVSVTTEKEKWFGTRYKLEYFSDEFIKKCETCELNPELHLPTPNEFIATDFQLFSKGQDSTRPQLPTKIKENEFCRLFYAGDPYYKLPNAYLFFYFRNPLAYADPLYSNINDVYIRLIHDLLVGLFYPATLAGLGYSLTAQTYGIQLMIYGYNHKIKQLLDKLIDQMINIKIEPQRFEIMKDRVKRALQNARHDVPYAMASAAIGYLTAQHQWSTDECLSCIDQITIRDVELFISRMFTRFYIDSLMYGNLTQDQAMEYMTSVEQKFREKGLYEPLFPAMWFNNRELSLPDGCNYAYKMLNDAHQVHAIQIYLQCFEETLENNVLLELFCHLVSEPCFDQLRTKEALGYVVNASVRCAGGTQGFIITVQTAKELDYVDQRIELFLDSIRDYISTMSDELFKQEVLGYMANKGEMTGNMASQGAMYWAEITIRQFCFSRPRLELEVLQIIQRDDILRFYDYFISPHSTNRRKLALHVSPSPLGLQSRISEIDAVKKKDKLAVMTGKRLPSTTNIKHAQRNISATGKKRHKKKNITEQPPIIDTLIKRSLKVLGSALADKNITLPKTEWIENVHLWKSKLPCYALVQPYEQIDVPVPY